VRARFTLVDNQMGNLQIDETIIEPSGVASWTYPRTNGVFATRGYSGRSTINIAFSGGGYDGVTAQVEVLVGSAARIPDETLRAGLGRALGKNPGQPILSTELAEVTRLDIRNQPITDLTGLEYATSLTELRLPRNSLGSVDLSPLSGLTSLTELDLNGNNIGDLTRLSGLTNLETLHLVDNNVSNLAPLSGLTSLRRLFLRQNPVADIVPLVANTGLGRGDTVDLRGNANTLNAAAYDTQIPALRDRNVTVQIDADPRPTISTSRTTLSIDTSQPHTRFRGYTIVLDQPPPSGRSVWVRFRSDNPAVSFMAGGLYFRSNNWNIPRTLMVRASIQSAGSATITHTYNGLAVAGHVNVNFGPAASIPNDNLRAGLTAALGKPSGDVILRSELAGLTSLSLNNRGITDLTGLEHATGLTELFIARNGLSNISALSGLTSLTELDLNGNNIRDLTRLSGLTNLETLHLVDNNISNLAPLSSLRSLRRLFLRQNWIADIAPLVANTGLGAGNTVDLRGNADLNAAAYDTQIPALRNRNVTVQADPRPPSSSEMVRVADRNLRAGLTAALGKPSRDVILRSELAGLTSLNLNNRRITDLTGLEHATGLTGLFIAGNGFSDISALSGLTSLTELDL